MARPRGPAEALEKRRRRAMELLRLGLSLNETARRVGSAPSSVMRWRDARRAGGPEALRVRSSPGRPPRLTPGERRRLAKVLLKGPQAEGLRSAFWTTRLVARVIRRRFGVRYHRDHVGRLMRSLGWRYWKRRTRRWRFIAAG